MTPHEFKDLLKAEQFGEINIIDREIGYVLGDHQHPYDVCALITSGEITLVVDGVSTTYAVGDIFRLSVGTVHHEYAGPMGANIWAGRRHQVQVQ